MARGITQEQVFDAADQLLLASERPTIERVRRSLGSGSPNTVNRHLEAWWKRLGDRVAAGKPAAGGRPPEVDKAVDQLWRAALQQAETRARDGMGSERQALTQEAESVRKARESIAIERAALTQAQELLKAELEQLRQALAAAQSRADTAERASLKGKETLQEAEKKIERLTAQLDAAKERAEGTQQHFMEKIATLEAQHDREVRRLKAEADRLRQGRKVDQAAVATAERALATAQGELNAVRRSEQSLRDKVLQRGAKKGAAARPRSRARAAQATS